MKKVLLYSLILALLAVSISFAAPKGSSPKQVEIKENFFIMQCNDIYLNPKDYMDKNIKYEGIYNESFDKKSKKTYLHVIRYGPGCCGNDGVAGFQIIYDGKIAKQNDWVEVIGKLEKIKEKGKREYLALRVISMKVLTKRGLETVSH